MKCKPFMIVVLFAILAVAAVADRSNGDAGNGFSYHGIEFKPFRDDAVEISGEIVNGSGKNSRLVLFDLAFYSHEGDIIAAKTLQIANFMDGESKPFQELVDGRLRDISAYSIQYRAAADIQDMEQKGAASKWISLLPFASYFLPSKGLHGA